MKADACHGGTQGCDKDRHQTGNRQDLEFTEPHVLDPRANHGEPVFNRVYLAVTQPSARVEQRLRLPCHFNLFVHGT